MFHHVQTLLLWLQPLFSVCYTTGQPHLSCFIALVSFDLLFGDQPLTRCHLFALGGQSFVQLAFCSLLFWPDFCLPCIAIVRSISNLLDRPVHPDSHLAALFSVQLELSIFDHSLKSAVPTIIRLRLKDGRPPFQREPLIAVTRYGEQEKQTP